MYIGDNVENVQQEKNEDGTYMLYEQLSLF